MRYIAYNFVAICFLVLAGLLAYWGKDGWGWVVFAALLTSVVPSSVTKSEKKNKKKSEDDNLAQVQGYKDFDSAPKGSK